MYNYTVVNIVNVIRYSLIFMAGRHLNDRSRALDGSTRQTNNIILLHIYCVYYVYVYISTGRPTNLVGTRRRRLSPSARNRGRRVQCCAIFVKKIASTPVRSPPFLSRRPCRDGNHKLLRKKVLNIRLVRRLLSILRTGVLPARLMGTLRRSGHDCQPPRCTIFPSISCTTRSVLSDRGLDLNKRVTYRIFSFRSESNSCL